VIALELCAGSVESRQTFRVASPARSLLHRTVRRTTPPSVMPTISSLTKLFQAIGRNDVQGAKGIAADIAREEADKGHHTAAQVLRGALQQNGHSWTLAEPAAAGRGGAISEALTPVHLKVRLEDVALRAPARGLFQECVREWKHRGKLAKLGIRRRHTFLFHGAPGCGKSYTAAALSNEMGLPLLVVRLEAVMGAFLGQTASHVRELFRFAEETPSVLLLDEVDALGRRRGDKTDIGEIDRVVISLMQELEHAQPLGLVIATSNLPGHLDAALFRRFDEVVTFPKPRKPEVLKYAKSIAASRGIIGPRNVAKTVEGAQNFADAKRRIEDAERRLSLKELVRRAEG
jgi:SpoVK/Ycf46/Vps4 family AAA+-type ATPase